MNPLQHPARARARWRRAGWGLAGIVAALAALVGWQQLGYRRAPAVASRMVITGGRAYGANCAPCHGARLEGRQLPSGTDAPPLSKPGFRFFFALLPGAMEGWIREQIEAGNAVMPPFAQRLDGDTLDALAYYVRAVNTGAVDLPVAEAPGEAASAAARHGR